jgi:hypothetical protein
MKIIIANFQLDVEKDAMLKVVKGENTQNMINIIMDNLGIDIPNGTMRRKEENIVDTESRNPSWLKAIPFLAHWIVDYIHSDPKLAITGHVDSEQEIVAKVISDNIERAVAEFKEENKSGVFDENLYDVLEDLTNILLKIANRKEVKESMKLQQCQRQSLQ